MSGKAKLKAPEGVTGCSWPAEAVAALADHGFVPADQPESAEDPPAE